MPEVILVSIEIGNITREWSGSSATPTVDEINSATFTLKNVLTSSTLTNVTATCINITGLSYSDTSVGIHADNIVGLVASNFRLDRISGTELFEIIDPSAGTPFTQNNVITEKRKLSITSITGEDKTYDGTDTATISSVVFSGDYTGGSVSVDVTATFDSSNVGNDKTITATNITPSDNTNYTVTTALSSVTTIADIFIRRLSAAITVNDKTYDGTNAAVISSVALTGTYDGDTVSVDTSKSIAKFVRNEVSTSGGVVQDMVVYSYSLDLSDKTNYTITNEFTASTTAKILRKNVYVDSISAEDKTYDKDFAAVTSVNFVGIPAKGKDIEYTSSGVFLSSVSWGLPKLCDGSTYELMYFKDMVPPLNNLPNTTADITDIESLTVTIDTNTYTFTDLIYAWRYKTEGDKQYYRVVVNFTPKYGFSNIWNFNLLYDPSSSSNWSFIYTNNDQNAEQGNSPHVDGLPDSDGNAYDLVYPGGEITQEDIENIIRTFNEYWTSGIYKLKKIFKIWYYKTEGDIKYYRMYYQTLPKWKDTYDYWNDKISFDTKNKKWTYTAVDDINTVRQDGIDVAYSNSPEGSIVTSKNVILTHFSYKSNRNYNLLGSPIGFTTTATIFPKEVQLKAEDLTEREKIWDGTSNGTADINSSAFISGDHVIGYFSGNYVNMHGRTPNFYSKYDNVLKVNSSSALTLSGCEYKNYTILPIPTLYLYKGGREICFYGSVTVQTSTGFKKIKDLKRGDLIATNDGYQPLAKLTCSFIKDEKERYVKFNKGCLNKNLPTQDITVTKQHPLSLGILSGKKDKDFEYLHINPESFANNNISGIHFVEPNFEEREYNLIFDKQYEINVGGLKFLSHHPNNWKNPLDDSECINKNNRSRKVYSTRNGANFLLVKTGDLLQKNNINIHDDKKSKNFFRRLLRFNYRC